MKINEKHGVDHVDFSPKIDFHNNHENLQVAEEAKLT